MTDTPTTGVPIGLNADETIAYANENPNQREAVRAAEQARDKPRKTVLDALDDAPGEYDPVDTDAYPERPLSEALAPTD